MTPSPLGPDATQALPSFRIPGGDDPASLRARIDALQSALDAQQRRIDELANGAGAFRLRPDGTLEIAANRIEVRAASVSFSASMVQVAGVLRCDTLIANSVVASSYSPGAGNVW